MIEEWRNIKDFPLYMVSNLGNIKSMDYMHTKKEHIISQRLTKCGYYIVNLNKDGKHYTKTVHRLVAQAFILKPKNLPEVNHKDEDKTNNVVTNLEWCTKSYNVKYKDGAKRRLAKRDKSTWKGHSYKKINQYSLKGEFIKRWSSVSDAARALGIDQGNISHCLLGKYKHCANFIWKYEEDVC